MGAVRDHLDALEHPARLAEVVALGKSPQARLFDAASGFRPIGLEHFVAVGRAPMREVVHHGKNSLPLFNRFAKVFCMPDDPSAAERELWGYNRNPALVETTVGPGYFVAHSHDREGEVLIDYLQQPPRKPDAWPPILPNSSRLSRFVYYRTQDVMRGVSEHVTIGRATKGGREMPNWFVLCRED
jgi:hypothetical protein